MSISLQTLQRWEPYSHGIDLTFQEGRARLAILSDAIFRFRATQDDSFAPRRSWDVAPPDDAFAPPSWDVEEREDALILSVGERRIILTKQGGLVSVEDGAGQRFAADLSPVTWGSANLAEARLPTREGDTLPEGRARIEARVRKAMVAGEAYYGFGQRMGLLDRRGRLMTNWTVDPLSGHGRHLDNMYQAHPVFIALRPGFAWGLFLHSAWYSQFDVGASDFDELGISTFGGEMDYYLFCGPTPAAVIDDLTRLTGRPFLPPLWALAYHQSRWSYLSEEEMRDMVREFKERDIPLDVLHFDIDYMHGYRDFTWDPERFPDPTSLLDDLREQGIRGVTIIDPGVKYDLYSGYQVAMDGVQEGVFVRNPDDTLFSGYCWPDAALPVHPRPRGAPHRRAPL